jgi:hypothetical protein
MSTYAKIEHSLYDNPKIVGLSSDAFRAYVEGILYSGKNLTDGFLDERIVSRMWGNDVAEELTSNDPVNPSWQRVEGGYLIYGFTERQNTKEHVESVKKKRKEAAQKRWDDAKGQQTVNKTDAKSMQNAYKTDAKGMPYTDTDTDTYIDNKNTSSPTVLMFDDFWNVWPRKEGKANALKAYQKAIKKISEPDLLAKVVLYVNSPNRPDVKFVPHAATWLNGERWLDDIKPVSYQREDDWMIAKQIVVS